MIYENDQFSYEDIQDVYSRGGSINIMSENKNGSQYKYGYFNDHAENQTFFERDILNFNSNNKLKRFF